MSERELLQTIRTAWESDAPIYDALPGHGLRGYEERAQLATELAMTFGSRPRRLLDVGTGTGALALLLAALGHDVVGIDLAGAMLREARRKAAALGLPVTFLQGEAASLPLPDDAVDGVISRHLLWTLPDPRAALREWMRVTRPGGTVAVMDGLWLDPALEARLRRAAARPLRGMARLLATGSGRQAAPAHADYDAVAARLPLAGGATMQQAIDLLREAGLQETQARDLRALRRAERAGRAWPDRIAAARVTWLATGSVPA